MWCPTIACWRRAKGELGRLCLTSVLDFPHVRPPELWHVEPCSARQKLQGSTSAHTWIAHQCAGVPRVFDRIYAGVLAKIKEAGGVKALLYSWGFRRKAYFLAQGARYNEVRAEDVKMGSVTSCIRVPHWHGHIAENIAECPALTARLRKHLFGRQHLGRVPHV